MFFQIKSDGKIEIESAMSFVLEYIPMDYLERALKGSMKCQRFMGIKNTTFTS